MKFSIAQDLLAEHLAIASRAIATNTTLPVLEYFLLKAEV
jgi:DNA polymerase III sliding clamp (beta) subunit (PCNA family)